MVRLQRVTFLALHNYLGLTTELFNPVGGKLISAHTFVSIHTQSLREAHTGYLSTTDYEFVHTQSQKGTYTLSCTCKLISHNIKHSIITQSFITLSENE